MSAIKLSICIPTYNFGEFIGETLESIIGQAGDEVEMKSELSSLPLASPPARRLGTMVPPALAALPDPEEVRVHAHRGSLSERSSLARGRKACGQASTLSGVPGDCAGADARAQAGSA